MVQVEKMIDLVDFIPVERHLGETAGLLVATPGLGAGLGLCNPSKTEVKASYHHYIFLSVSLCLFLSFVSIRLCSFHIQSHGSPDKCYLYFPLFSPSSLDRVFAFCLGLRCAAKAGQSECKTAPGGECTQVFKVFPCKFRVPALSTEPISGTVVKEALHRQEPGARVKTRSVL